MKRIRFAAVLLIVGLVGCTRDSGIITGPETPAVMTEEQRTQLWIDRMDPFVFETPDRLTHIDEAGFYKTYGAPAGDDGKTVYALKSGIAIYNQHVLAGDQASGGLSPEGTWINWHWWGVTVCMNGTAAQNFIASANGGSVFLPGVWKIVTIPVTLMNIYLNMHGVVCVNSTWIGQMWLSG